MELAPSVGPGSIGTAPLLRAAAQQTALGPWWDSPGHMVHAASPQQPLHEESHALLLEFGNCIWGMTMDAIDKHRCWNSVRGPHFAEKTHCRPGKDAEPDCEGGLLPAADSWGLSLRELIQPPSLRPWMSVVASSHCSLPPVSCRSVKEKTAPPTILFLLC